MIYQCPSLLIWFNQFVGSIGKIGGPAVAPVVTATSIGSKRTVIKLSSEHAKDAVLYCIRYRKKTFGDDQKEAEWKEVELPQNSDSLPITTIAGTNYEVYASYVLNGSLQSEKSYLLRFTSLFEFNSGKKSDKMSLSLDNTQFLLAKSHYCSIASKTVC